MDFGLYSAAEFNPGVFVGAGQAVISVTVEGGKVTVTGGNVKVETTKDVGPGTVLIMVVPSRVMVNVDAGAVSTTVVTTVEPGKVVTEGGRVTVFT